MFNYLGQLIVFLAAFIAVKGGTWDTSKLGIKKLTVIGFIAIALASLGFSTSLVTVHQSNRASEDNSRQLDEAVNNTKEAKDRAEELQQQLSTMEIQLNRSQALLKKVRAESERQIQRVSQYVELYPSGVWEAPWEAPNDIQHIYGGSTMEFYGFTNNLLLVYGEEFHLSTSDLRRLARDVEGGFLNTYVDENLRYQIIPPNISAPCKTAIVGRSGIAMRWALVNLRHSDCEGKVFVEFTPHIRSTD